ncbi:hypothetical protein QVD17_19995 [Tagetes erecta]|uniref:Uncharacterized protein n=1 Tax=Tagetes erecta TaxID=13708 RepID=A0AAD8KP31_TARER|nr:hypothetical protein QVD17_19995 [Tagetes erecta]
MEIRALIEAVTVDVALGCGDRFPFICDLDAANFAHTVAGISDFISGDLVKFCNSLHSFVSESQSLA